MLILILMEFVQLLSFVATRRAQRLWLTIASTMRQVEDLAPGASRVDILLVFSGATLHLVMLANPASSSAGPSMQIF